MKILFVEDNPGDAMLMKEVFRKLSLTHELEIMDDGAKVLPALRNEGSCAGAKRPDLVLLDLNMPKISGLDILKEMKSDLGTSAIPVIVFTSSQSPRDVEDSYRHCANAVLTKPMDLKGLMETVKALHDFWCVKAVIPKRRDPAAAAE